MLKIADAILISSKGMGQVLKAFYDKIQNAKMKKGTLLL